MAYEKRIFASTLSRTWFYLFLGFRTSFSMIHPFVWAELSMLLMSGLLMNQGKSWGCLLGILAGCHLIYMGAQEIGQIIKETPFGVVMVIYYLICGMISKR